MDSSFVRISVSVLLRHSRQQAANVKTFIMNLIRSLLIFLLLMTLAFCGRLNNKLDKSNLLIDNREVQTFGSAVSSVLHKAVNEFRIVRVVVVIENLEIRDRNEDFSDHRENYQFNLEISEIMRSTHGMFVIEVVDFQDYLDRKRKVS